MISIKKTYHHGNLREALLLETETMIAENQLSAITLLAISKRLAVARSAPYRHFSSKNDLLCAVASRAFRRFKQGFQRIRLNTTLSVEERFRGMGHFYLYFAVENPNYYTLMFRENLMGDNQTEELELAREASIAELFAILQNCQDEGLIAQGNLEMQALYIWSNWHGLCSLLVDQHLPSDEHIDETLTFFLNKTLGSLSV